MNEHGSDAQAFLSPPFNVSARYDPPRLTIDALPVDILPLIFEYAPLRARLWTISFVCKKWRVVALRSVTSISWPMLPKQLQVAFEIELPPRIWTLFPSLTALNVNVMCRQPTLSTTLRHLRLGPLYCSWLYRLPSDQPRLLTTYYPRLTSLSVDTPSFTEEAEPMGKFVAMHSSQLTSLTLCGEVFWSALLKQRASFPSLTDLAMHFISLCCDDFATIIASCPRLRSLRLWACGRIFELSPTLLTSVVHLIARNASNEDYADDDDLIADSRLPALIARMPRLRHVEFSREPPDTRFDNVLFYLWNADFDRLRTATNVKRLSIGNNIKTASFPESLRFPFLEELMVHSHTTDLCAVARFFVPRSPCLSRIMLHFDGSASPSWSLELAALVREAIQHGVAGIYLSGDGAISLGSEFAIATKYGWVDLQSTGQRR